MRKTVILASVLLMAAIVVIARLSAFGFGEIGGSCEKDCAKCHTITKEEAKGILNALSPSIEVTDVRQAPVRGLWEIDLKVGGRPGIVYMDFSKGNIIQGQILGIKERKDFTTERMRELTRVDFSKIPLKEALLLGKKDAKYRAVVFDDPE